MDTTWSTPELNLWYDVGKLAVLYRDISLHLKNYFDYCVKKLYL